MTKPRSRWAAVAMVLLAGCSSGPSPAPGSDRVLLTQNPADVAGAELIGTTTGRQGSAHDVSGAMVWARNYVSAVGGDIGLVAISPGAHSRVVTVTAYRDSPAGESIFNDR